MHGSSRGLGGQFGLDLVDGDLGAQVGASVYLEHLDQHLSALCRGGPGAGEAVGEEVLASFRKYLCKGPGKSVPSG